MLNKSMLNFSPEGVLLSKAHYEFCSFFSPVNFTVNFAYCCFEQVVHSSPTVTLPSIQII